MRPRHEAALAFVIWYLMVPPHPFAEEPPPPSEWSVYHVYDAADTCEYARLEIAGGLLEDPPPDFLQRFGNTFMQTFDQARCVFSDDLRRKGS